MDDPELRADDLDHVDAYFFAIISVAGVDEPAAYAAMTWIGWVPTLVVAEWLIEITWRRWPIDQKAAWIRMAAV